MTASPDTLDTLLIQEDADSIMAQLLAIATLAKLPVTTWQAGDPTRTLFTFESKYLARLDATITGYAQSGFLDFAEGQWLIVKALQDFGYVVPTATFAETSVVLTNAGASLYDLDPGDVVVKSSISGKTYKSTSGGTLGPSGTLSINVTADEAGSASTAAAGEIDTMVTTFLNVTCTNPTAAVGTDTQDEDTTRQQCRDSAAALSPNGPADVYRFVALNPALTGISTPTRARAYPSSETGDVLLYLAGAAGALPSGDVAAVAAAITQYATPLCITVTVASANNIVINITYSMSIYASVNQTSAQIQTAVQNALIALFQKLPIGGDVTPPSAVGFLYASRIQGAIENVFPDKTITVSFLPTFFTAFALSGDEVPVLGAVTGLINIVPDPH